MKVLPSYEDRAQRHAAIRLFCFNILTAVFVGTVLFFIWTIVAAAEPLV